METILKPFISRFAQPVILSFCIAWIFWNWEIVVGLLWYDNKSLYMYGYCNYRDLIIHKSSWCRNFIGPAIVAAFYPILRFLLNWFTTFIRTAERNKLLDVSGTGNVSTLKYLALRKSYDEKIAELSKYLNEQNDMQIKVNNADKELLEIKGELSKAREKIGDLENKSLSLDDDRHALSMERKDYEDSIQNLKESLTLAEQEGGSIMNDYSILSGKVTEYEFKSTPFYISGNYNLFLSKYENGEHHTFATSPGNISQGGKNFELLINDDVIAEITSYSFNILTNKIVLYLADCSQGVDLTWPVITGIYHEFSILEDKTGYRSQFKNGNTVYLLELIKR